MWWKYVAFIGLYGFHVNLRIHPKYFAVAQVSMFRIYIPDNIPGFCCLGINYKTGGRAEIWFI